MARKVFFSFHFQRDYWRVGQVRNADALTRRFEASRYLDKAAWQQVERKGNRAIKEWIDHNLYGTSVTVVLIGAETNARSWVHYEIEQSWANNKGLLGIRIHQVKDSYGCTDRKGENPFRYYYFDENLRLSRRAKGENEWFGLGVFLPRGKKLLSDHIKTYDWKDDNGRQNIGSWIEEAAKWTGR